MMGRALICQQWKQAAPSVTHQPRTGALWNMDTWLLIYFIGNSMEQMKYLQGLR